MDINQFLIEKLNPALLNRVDATAFLHTPCTLRNVCKTPNAPLKLLNQIPGLTVVPFSQISYCCGAAGSYMVEHPTTADALVEPLINECLESNARYLVTSNIGCALHLQGALKRAGQTRLKVVHPVQLIAQSLQI